MLITCIMLSKENINVPEVSESPIHGAGYKPLTGGTSYFTAMKMIEDLGCSYPTPKSKTKKHYAIYECPLCKKLFKSCTYAVNRGDIKACRCSSFGTPRHGMWRSSIYKIWSMMRGRCSNPNNPSFKNYGGRGISVCDEWDRDFMIFHEWAKSNGYKKESRLGLNRIDNDKGYFPENCEFTTSIVNNQNTRLIQRNNTSGYRGVFYSKLKKDKKKWEARIGCNNREYHLGYFLTPTDAARAYNNFVTTHNTNHPLNKI